MSTTQIYMFQSEGDITLAILISALSLGISTAALMLSILNYLRDQHKVKVQLQWDAGERYEGTRSNVKERWGHIYVTNVGRRPVFITKIGLSYPDDPRIFNLLYDEDTAGIKLEEGAAPIVVRVPQDEALKKYAKDWNKIYAIAIDSTGEEYKSKLGVNRPSWAISPTKRLEKKAD